MFKHNIKIWCVIRQPFYTQTCIRDLLYFRCYEHGWIDSVPNIFNGLCYVNQWLQMRPRQLYHRNDQGMQGTVLLRSELSIHDILII